MPQAIENPKLQRAVKKGAFRAEELVRLETLALGSLRAYDRDELGLEETLHHVLVYSAPLVEGKPYEDCAASPLLARLAERYRATLAERPWKQCSCKICTQTAIDVIIFRGSNRNKRRGIHNLAVYQDHIERLDLKRAVEPSDDLPRSQCAAEQ